MRIGSIQLTSPFVQAGLEGHSDMPMRVVARRRGCSFALTEAMNDEMIALGGSHVRRRLAVRDEDRPLAGQIMGVEPEMMARAAQVLAGLGYDAVDVNLACPVRKITRLRGGHLLTQPATAIAMLRAVRDAVPAHIPVTVKLRRATDDAPGAAERFLEIFAAVWDAGLDAACVHGRTVEQGYRGTADWEHLTALKRAYPARTILGSGDLFTGADAVRRIRETGVDGVWFARGAIGNPWIFGDAAALWSGGAARPAPSFAQQAEALGEHYALTLATYPGEKIPPRMRSVFLGYARLHPQQEAVRQAVFALRTVEDVEALITRYFQPSAERAAAAPAPRRAAR